MPVGAKEKRSKKTIWRLANSNRLRKMGKKKEKENKWPVEIRKYFTGSKRKKRVAG
jgi:hypothetical protein